MGLKRRRDEHQRQQRGRPFQVLVADIARAFDPGATVKEGDWVPGPDGRLDMDVSIRGGVNGRNVLAVIECKDFGASTTGPVGRGYVDALDSKRHDLEADIAIICSNSGFTRDALSKAKRKGIGLISVLKEGDERVRAVIEEEVYLRRIRFGKWTMTYHGHGGSIRDLKLSVHSLRFEGRSLDSWLQKRATLIAAANPDVTGCLRADFRFKEPLVFEAPGGTVTLRGATVFFSYRTQWLKQVVQVDASLGLYDYLRGRVRLAPGTAHYIIRGINFDTALPVARPDQLPKFGPHLGEDQADIRLAVMEGIATEQGEKLPDLEKDVVTEDLTLTVDGFPEPWGLEGNPPPSSGSVKAAVGQVNGSSDPPGAPRLDDS